MTPGLRIVIVEDDALIAMDLADVLIGMGHDIQAVVQTEAAAVTAAAEFRPDLMIVDGSLAEGHGAAAMREILVHGFVPHFYITGDPLKIEGVTSDTIVLAKPFNLRDLGSAIARVKLSAPAIGMPSDEVCPPVIEV